MYKCHDKHQHHFQLQPNWFAILLSNEDQDNCKEVHQPTFKNQIRFQLKSNHLNFKLKFDWNCFCLRWVRFWSQVDQELKHVERRFQEHWCQQHDQVQVKLEPKLKLKIVNTIQKRWIFWKKKNEKIKKVTSVSSCLTLVRKYWLAQVGFGEQEPSGCWRWAERQALVLGDSPTVTASGLTALSSSAKVAEVNSKVSTRWRREFIVVIERWEMIWRALWEFYSVTIGRSIAIGVATDHPDHLTIDRGIGKALLMGFLREWR